MKLEHITNSGPYNFYSAIEGELLSCTSFSFAVSFISKEGTELIEKTLLKNKNLTNGQLLISAFNYFNEVSVLQKLQQLSKRYSSKLQIHISLNKTFHWKYYKLSKAATELLFVGSANFTTGGLSENGEIMVRMASKKTSSKSEFDSLNKSFIKEWDFSKPIMEFPLEHYPQKVRAATLPTPKKLLIFSELLIKKLKL